MTRCSHVKFDRVLNGIASEHPKIKLPYIVACLARTFYRYWGIGELESKHCLVIAGPFSLHQSVPFTVNKINSGLEAP